MPGKADTGRGKEQAQHNERQQPGKSHRRPGYRNKAKRRGWTGYLVIIVPRVRRRYETPLGTNRPVSEIDGASFYHKVTGDPNALHDLFDVLCDELTSSQEIADYCRQVMTDSIPARINDGDAP